MFLHEHSYQYTQTKYYLPCRLNFFNRNFLFNERRTKQISAFLHLPLQAASNKVLKDMRRKYSFEEYQDFIQQAYSEVPDICLGTDIIVGFPTENEAEFEESYQNLQKMPLHYYHVFPFSARKKTRAYHLAEHLPADTIQKRASLVRNLSQKKRKLFYQTQLGKIKKVLFETCKEDNIWFGYTDNYVRVKTREKNIQKTLLLLLKFKRWSLCLQKLF